MSFIVTLYMSKAMAKVLRYVNYVTLSSALAVVLVALSYAVAGLWGILLTLAATSIGFAALVFNTRLSHCLGVLILPVLLSMTGALDLVLPLIGLGW